MIIYMQYYFSEAHNSHMHAKNQDNSTDNIGLNKQQIKFKFHNLYILKITCNREIERGERELDRNWLRPKEKEERF